MILDHRLTNVWYNTITDGFPRLVWLKRSYTHGEFKVTIKGLCRNIESITELMRALLEVMI